MPDPKQDPDPESDPKQIISVLHLDEHIFAGKTILSQFPYPMTLTMVQLGSIALWSPPMLKVSPIVCKIKKPVTVNKKPENFGRKPVFQIRRIHIFLARICHYMYGSGSFHQQGKKLRKTLMSRVETS